VIFPLQFRTVVQENISVRNLQDREIINSRTNIIKNIINTPALINLAYLYVVYSHIDRYYSLFLLLFYFQMMKVGQNW